MTPSNMMPAPDYSTDSPPKCAPKTQAGVYLCRRFNAPPAIADLLASLAGLGEERAAA